MNRVGIFWDYENCAPPTGTSGYVVAERLRAACGAHGSVTQFRAYLELSTSNTPQPNLNASNLGGSTDPSHDVFSYPSTSAKTLALRSELQSSGVSLIDCPHNSRKNVADTMLACDLVCFALDHPTTPHAPQAGFIPSSPYSIPSTPFSYIPAPLVAPPKTTVVLVSGDRDFAYPLAVLKARRYEVGLIVPPGGAHPALRAQASWVLNWKDVLEDTGASTATKGDLGASAGVRGGADVAGADGRSSGLGVLMGVSGQPTESRPIMRRSSFASRRGSVSVSRRGSTSTPTNPVPPVPPPPGELPPAKAGFSSTHASPGSSVHGGPTTPIRRPPLPPPPPEEPSPSPQTSIGPRPARRPSVRRAAKTGSRPPSRSRSRAGMRGGRQERTEQEATSPNLVEQQRPRPTIVPVALTPSPVGSVGPSFAGMSPRASDSTLFSTQPTSPPPTLAPPPTPPVKPSTPPAKPPTPPRDMTHPIHKPTIPHVATPRPPLPTSQEPPTTGKQGSEASTHEARPSTPVQAALSPTSNATALQTLVPVASALRPTARPALTVPALAVQQASAPGLTPATPVTPPASPPFRWARLQPVYDGTDVEADKMVATEKKARKGKEKSKGESSMASNDAVGEAEQTKPEGTAVRVPEASNTRREPGKLAVEVGLQIKSSEEPSAIISGVDSILRSYAERTPGVDGEGQHGHFDQDRDGTPMPSAEGYNEDNRASKHEDEDEDEDEEKFDESYFASLSRAPAVTPAWTPPTALALETPPTVKAMPLDFASGESTATIHTDDFQRPLFSTPRPAPRTYHSLPIMQSLLAGVEGTYDESQHNVNRASGIEEEMGHIERLRSRSKSPPAAPAFSRRTTSLPTSTSPVVLTTADSQSRHSTGSTSQEFRVLISVLERYRSEGNLRPLRSLIGAELSRARETFGRVGAGSFREYVHRAVTAGVVDVGGGQIQGQEWISLSRHWQQFD